MQLEKLTTDIEGAIDRAAVAVMEVHKKIARVPFDLAAQLQPIADRARKVHDTQDRMIDVMYDSIRKVNRAVFEGLTSMAHMAAPAPVPEPGAPADPGPARRKKPVEVAAKV